jgi:hypothetical protein
MKTLAVMHRDRCAHRISGTLAGFSLERLMNLLTAVDFDVEIVIRKKPRSRKAARIKGHQSPRPLPSPAKPHKPMLR